MYRSEGRAIGTGECKPFLRPLFVLFRLLNFPGRSSMIAGKRMCKCLRRVGVVPGMVDPLDDHKINQKCGGGRPSPHHRGPRVCGLAVDETLMCGIRGNQLCRLTAMRQVIRTGSIRIDVSRNTQNHDRKTSG